MKTLILPLLLFSVYICTEAEEGTIGTSPFGIDDAEFKAEKDQIVIPQIDEAFEFDGTIKSIKYNGHYKGKVSVLVLRRDENDKKKFAIVAKQDVKVKKKKVGKNGKLDELDIPVKAGDVIGLYAKKKNLFNYKNDRKCRGKTASYISEKKPSTNVGQELTFNKLRKKQNRCRSYPVLITYEAAACGPVPVDVFFVVDISKSIKDHDLVTQREAMHYFFNHFDISESTGRIGVIKYKADTVVEIALGAHTNKDDLIAAPVLTRGPLSEQKGGTRTDLAMDQMMDEFAKTAGSGRPQVCILLTDGKATAGASEMAAMISRLEATDILSVAVGIGRDADFDELSSIATGPELDNVYHVSNFDQLKQISQNVVTEICEELLPSTPPTTPGPTTLPPPVCADEPLDVYFVVDISKSISDKELAQEQTALRFFFNNLNIASDGARVALIKYHNFAEEEFGLNAYTSREQLEAVDVLTRGFIKGGTRTDMAMELMMDNFKADKATGRKRVAILLTDGRATAKLDNMIARLEDTDIKSIAVGIGDAADETELARIATGEGSANVYKANNFDALMNIVREVVSQACT